MMNSNLISPHLTSGYSKINNGNLAQSKGKGVRVNLRLVQVVEVISIPHNCMHM